MFLRGDGECNEDYGFYDIAKSVLKDKVYLRVSFNQLNSHKKCCNVAHFSF